MIVLVLLSSLSLPAQEEGPEKKEDPRASLEEKRRDVLRYGIDSEVIELMATLREEEYDDLNAEILELYVESRNTELKARAAETLAAMKYEPSRGAAREILEDYPADERLVTASMDLLIKLEDRESVPLLRSYAEDENPAIALKAVFALGELGSVDETEFLRSLWESEDMASNVRAEMLSALGKIGASESIPFLTGILQDENQERSFRWRACQALGSIGDPESLSAIEAALNDGDTILRTFAIRALREFDGDLVYEYFIDALRDSFWRVRLAAIETLGERKEKQAVDILEYKAKNDPEEKIRLAALTALGAIGGGRSLDVLRDIMETESSSQVMRISAMHILIRENIGAAFKSIDKILEQEWDKPNSRLIIELVKAMSSAEHPRLAGYFERFLAYPDVSVVLMTLRGIERNGFVQLKEKVRELSEARTASSIKTTAASVLDSL
jgi:HEAT repeat protein